MATVKFGGPVGVVRDPVSSAMVRPQAAGEATVEGDATEEAAQQAILRAVSDTLAKAKASLIKIAEAPELATRVAAAASEALGAKVEISTFELTFSDDDLKALKS
jgi:hypothetical protein